MAKMKPGRSSHEVSDVEADPRQTSMPGTEPAEAATPEKPAPTQGELEALFGAYEGAHGELVALDAQRDALIGKRSETVKALVETIGNKGPWTVRGVRMSVTERGGKYHMTREGDSKLTFG